MEFKLKDKEEKMLRPFRELCKGTFEAAAAGVDAHGVIPEAHWTALAEGGYLGLGYEPAYTGQGQPMHLWTHFGEALASHCAATFAATTASSVLFGGLIQQFGTPHQKEKYLPPLARGEFKGAVALTDAKGAPVPGPLATGAKKVEGGILIDGLKPYVTNGPICDAVLVMAGAGSDGAGTTFLIVDGDTPGMSRGAPVNTMGIRGCAVGPLAFDKCHISNDNILGDAYEGRKILAELLTLQRIWWAVYGVGIGQACIDAAIGHATARVIGEKAIARHQEVHFKIAEMHMMTDTARPLTHKAAWLLDQGQPAGITAACAKLLATEMATECSHQALQIHGARGFIQGSTVERLYRDARLGELEGETSEILRGILAGDVLNEFSV